MRLVLPLACLLLVGCAGPHSTGALWAQQNLEQELVANGLATGEIAPELADPTRAILGTVLLGLVHAVSDDLQQHRFAIDGIKAVLEQRLLRPPVAGRPASKAAAQSASRAPRTRRTAS